MATKNLFVSYHLKNKMLLMVTSICMSILQQIIHVGKHKSKCQYNSTYHITSDENIVKMMWAIT